MTNYQRRTILGMLLDILKGCESVEEAVEKVERLLKDDDEGTLSHKDKR